MEQYAGSGVIENETALTQTLQEEIFWKDGYFALATLREKSGNAEAALAAMVACSHHYPAMDVLEKTRQLAERAGKTGLAKEYAELLAMAETTLRDTNFFKIRYRTISETATAMADNELTTMVKGWRKAYGKTMPQIFV